MTMKVQTEQQQVIGLTKVAKGRASREERDVSQGGAIQGLLDKLKDLVPNMPRSKKLTRLEIIQNVIDYILDLEIALEAHPTQLSSSAPAVSTRQPLGVLPPANNSATNALSEDEVTHAEKVIRHFAALAPAVASTNAISSLDL
ncbi:protein extra-macrochaetae [Rhipicephalus sanguineus]|uniref:protein extra-macrochaetae n=1 Tax=Rhipicephalus sanguineus TaxID=34632 RepID=UPI001895E828|nr:protein extra-macrochaetae [Rhipicephalus sanguineus]